MSEPAVEPEPGIPLEEPESPVEPTEPETAPEPTPEPASPEEPNGGDTEPPEGTEDLPPAPPAPDSQGARDQKDIDRIHAKMDTLRELHAERVAKIVGLDAEALIACPLCSHFSPGYVGLVELPETAIPGLRAMLGMPDLTNYTEAEDARECPRCQGKGRVLTGSKVPGYEVKDCGGCGGIGWIGEGAPASDGGTAEPVGAAVTGPTIYAVETDDPQVASLRERGFTVIPPMRTE